MKRIALITSTAAMLVALALLPAVASARSHHHRHHHAATKARLRTFGATTSTSTSTTPAPESAGTVTSFTAGVLTIKLTDGTIITGKVTTATELKCEAAPVPATARVADHGGGQGGGPSVAGISGGNDGHGGPGSSDTQGQPGGAPTESDDNNGAGETGPAEPCELTSVKEGMIVQRAELSISSAGATFRELDIIR
jgi:hypothetical protein